MKKKKPASPAPLTLTTPQVIAAVARLDDLQLTQQTLQEYSATRLVVPSRPAPATGGRGLAHRYTLADLARLRLVLKLRGEGLPMQRVRRVVAEIADRLPELLRPNTRAVLEVVGGRAVIVRRPGEADVEIPGTQLRLPLVDCVKGNAEIARDVRRVA